MSPFLFSETTEQAVSRLHDRILQDIETEGYDKVLERLTKALEKHYPPERASHGAKNIIRLAQERPNGNHEP